MVSLFSLLNDNNKKKHIIDKMLKKGIPLREIRMLLKSNKKGQINRFSMFIMAGLAFLIFIFAAPILSSFIGIGASQTGTATAFVMKSFMWIIIIILIVFLIRILGGSEWKKY